MSEIGEWKYYMFEALTLIFAQQECDRLKINEFVAPGSLLEKWLSEKMFGLVWRFGNH